MHSQDPSKILVWLSSQLTLKPDRLKLIMSEYSDLETAVADSFRQCNNHKWLEKFVKPHDLSLAIDQLYDELDRHQVKVVTTLDNTYPEKLRIVEDYPIVLYYQGDWSVIANSQMITVVGSRNFARYSETVMNKILDPVCQNGVGVVSGLATGIDGLSHEIALQSGSPTIGITGSGLADQVFYPTQHTNLKSRIIQSGGIVISEYSPLTKATIYSFPQRNRILAALTELTWVVQAGHKSGTLITAGLARDLGKAVATTPASILDKGFAGNIQLLKDGASIVTEAEDIFQLMGLQKMSTTPTQQILFGSDQEKLIYTHLDFEPINTDMLSQKTQINSVEVSMHLTMLELGGLAQSIGENRWVRCR